MPAGIPVRASGPFRTAGDMPAADPRMPPDGLARIGGEAPPERAAQPEEIAQTYVHLASDPDSSCTVGEVIAVTGGIVHTR